MDIMNMFSQMPQERFSDMQVCDTFFSNARTSQGVIHPSTGLAQACDRASDVCFPDTIQQDTRAPLKSAKTSRVTNHLHRSILPGLPDDVAKHCLALVHRSYSPSMGAVSRRWRSLIGSNEFMTVRRLAGVVEEWIYILVADADGNGSHWEVQDCWRKHHQIPPMPGHVRDGFNVVVINGKLLVIAGYLIKNGPTSASADVYQYDTCLNSWSKLADMNVPRYDFACAEVNGMVYAVGGYGVDGKSLSSAEVYDPNIDKWTMIESLRRPRYGCFAYGFAGNLYVMGGRSKFSIGNFKKVDVYNPESRTWCEMKNGCVMVTTHAVLGNQMFCIEWKNQRKLTIFNPEFNSWKTVPVPVTGSSCVGFRFGILDGKLLLFPVQGDPGCKTLVYDPNATPGKEWGTSEIKPSGSCLCSVTIKA
ncbi:hypothetical protein LIER_01071 [Lithospermum erythrorhizon]|uniref:F-box domain-containing protein n=1 Tax=Lithospermum erythrorhizon TaxID=34254 RepID=A0AAV3NK57_LITER